MEPTLQPIPEPAGSVAEEPKPKKSGGLTVFLSISLILVSILAGFFAWQNQKLVKSLREQLASPTPTPATIPSSTPDPTADWETYTNNNYSFSIKFPKTWTKESNTNTNKEKDLLSIVTVGKTQTNDTEFYDGARVTIANPIITNTGVAVWVKEYYPALNIDGQPNIFSEETKNSLNFHKVYTCGLGCFTYYNIKHNGYIFRIMVFADGPDKVQHQQTIDQILSTFKFLDSETSNWKEYQVKSLGLTFKAPFEMNVDIAGSIITIQDYPINAPPPDNFYKAVITVSGKAIGKSETLPPTTKNKETTDKILETFVFAD